MSNDVLNTNLKIRLWPMRRIFGMLQPQSAPVA